MAAIADGLCYGLACSGLIVGFVILGVALCRVSGRASRVEESLTPAFNKPARDE